MSSPFGGPAAETKKTRKACLFLGGEDGPEISLYYTWKGWVRRMLTWLQANGRLENSDLDTYEDRLIGRWEAQTAAT